MLTYVIESFGVSPDCASQLQELVFSYHKFMISEGFLGHKHDIFFEADATGRVVAGGVLANAGYPWNGLELAGTSKELNRRFLANRKDITRLANEVDVQLLNVPYSEDDHYCNHDVWRGLVLQADCPSGITPIVCCDCAGLVGRYRVPFSEQIRVDIWDWDVGSYCVEACWSASGVFEAWGNGERHDPLSRLNVFGLSIVKRIQSETGIDTWLHIPARNSTTVTTCPLCEDDMTTVDTQCFWNYACPRCRIVTCLDVTP